MNAVKFLYAAYAAVWIIHGFYLGSLAQGYRRVRQQMKELHNNGK